MTDTPSPTVTCSIYKNRICKQIFFLNFLILRRTPLEKLWRQKCHMQKLWPYRPLQSEEQNKKELPGNGGGDCRGKLVLMWWRLWKFAGCQADFNIFLLYKEHTERIFWYHVTQLSWEPSKIGHFQFSRQFFMPYNHPYPFEDYLLLRIWNL